ncbi:MAG TPA: SufD family Fe-S cluster assembly protein [Rubrivivax sp.]|nr:SufD family Fe-S cluster assembly protein [Rubrivivax sp.]
MDAARADALSARHRLAAEGWISPRAESFRHLPPPAAEAWLGGAIDAARIDCEASPLAGAGWTLHPVGVKPSGGVEARWLDATDAAQRAELFAGIAPEAAGEAAPFTWAHRALCRLGLRLQVGGRGGPDRDQTTWLQLRRMPLAAVEAPLLVVDLADGVHCVLIETHERELSACSHRITQNLQVQLRLGRGARLSHLRVATPGPQDQWAHKVHARLDAGAHYEQLLIAAGSGYHLQHSTLELHAERASARLGSVLFAAGSALQQQLRASHQAAQTRSAVEALVLASGRARAVVDAHAHIAPGAAQAEVRQRLAGIPTAGAPKLVLQPHLEIEHDQVQAAHGATWGSLPEDALFYARQRGLAEDEARALILDGMAQAVAGRVFADAALPAALGIDGLLARQVARHLAATTGEAHG